MRRYLGVTLLTTLLPTTSSWAQPAVQVLVVRDEIVINVGPLEIAPSTPYSHHAAEAYHQIEWPASGWLRGYRVDLADANGAPLPRSLLHHAGMANLDRRQIAYPMAERVFAAAHETKPVAFPASIGLPLVEGQRMVLYYALVNPDSVAIEGVTLQVRIRWAHEREKLQVVLPFYASAKADTKESISFDIPAGHSSTSAEFTLPAGGWVRALGGHLHDHGVELRLEDAETSKVLARIRARRAEDGRLLNVARTIFPWKRRGLRLRANHRYRVVAEYDNPTDATIRGGAMGFLAGAFIPEDVNAFTRVASDPVLERDVLLGGARAAGTAAGGHSHH